MTMPPIDKSFVGTMKDWLMRLTAVERRLALGTLPGRLAADTPDLPTDTDLNNILETGWYVQRQNADATLALNYPLTRAGHLEVSSSGGSGFVYQTYTEFQGSTAATVPARKFYRTFYSGTWSPWWEHGPVRLTTDWNTCTQPSFVASNSGAANTPDSTKSWTGTVYWEPAGGLIQEVRTPSITSTAPEFKMTYRRRWSGSNWSTWIPITGGDTGWQTLTIASPWVGTSAPQYRVQDGVCYFRGEIYGGTDISTVFTMPDGARPITRLSHLAVRSTGTTVPAVLSIHIQTTGVATGIAYSGTIPTGSPGYTLGTLSYRVE